MTKGLFSGLRAMIDRFFPERQFYHRSHGEVHFVSLSGRMQMFYVTLTLSFLTWVGYASVNVVFKEQIISEKERNFVIMQKQYEQRLVELGAAYDEINSVLVLAEENFQDATRDLERRHEQLESLVDHKQALNETFDEYREVHLAEAARPKDQTPGQTEVLMRVTELEPSARRSRLAEVEPEGTVQAVTNALSVMLRKSVTTQDAKGSLTERVATLQNRVEQLRNQQQQLIYDLEEASQNRTAQARAILEVTGLDVEQVYEKFTETVNPVGGPLITLQDSEDVADLEGTDDDPVFRRQIFRLANKLQELSAYEAALVNVPLINPVNTDWRTTSRYGPRRDPFTKRRAFHNGLDMSGPRNATIVAAAPGVVKYAGPKGPYGNLVEIDHGFGFKTRYGHLAKIHVRGGEKVDFYQEIGLMGSTGRSTARHLHYEVWFNNKLRNPEKFIEAGKYVFKE